MTIFRRAGRERREPGDALQLALWSPRDAAAGWQVRISRRARRLSMRVSPGGRVEVVVPPGVGIPAVERFVAKHRDWAERRVRELALHAPHAADRRPVCVALALSAQRWDVEYAAVEPVRGVGHRRGRVAGQDASGHGCAGGTGAAALVVPRGRRTPAGAAGRGRGGHWPRLHEAGPATPAHALGQLLDRRYGEPERLPDVPAAGGGAIPDGSRTLPSSAHESFGGILETGGSPSSRIGARSTRSWSRAGATCRAGSSRSARRLDVVPGPAGPGGSGSRASPRCVR